MNNDFHTSRINVILYWVFITRFRSPQWPCNPQGFLDSLMMASIKWPKHVGVIE
jgi:hypothetical protein